MNITISGGSKKLYDLAHSIVDYCGKTILSKQLYNTISIDLEFDRSLYKDSGVLAEVDFDDRNHKPREFTITVDCTVSKRRIMESIAHEMVHVKQYAKGEMVDLERCGSTKWQNKIIGKETNYWDRPWEVEAHGKELGLFVRWAEDNLLGSQAWTQEKYN